MEQRARSLTVGDLLGRIAAKTPTPGGGAVAPIVSALAAALGQMVVSYSLGRKNLAEREPGLRASIDRLERARSALLELADEDASAYELVRELSRLPEGDARRRSELPGAVEIATRVPLASSAAALTLLRHILELAPRTNRSLRSDLAIAAILAEASVRASAVNVRINLPAFAREKGRESADGIARELDGLCADAAEILRGVLGATA